MFYEVYYRLAGIGSGYVVIIHCGNHSFTSERTYLTHDAACRVARKMGAKKLPE